MARISSLICWDIPTDWAIYVFSLQLIQEVVLHTLGALLDAGCDEFEVVGVGDALFVATGLVVESTCSTELPGEPMPNGSSIMMSSCLVSL
jgi:hypothetical protein